MSTTDLSRRLSFQLLTKSLVTICLSLILATASGSARAATMVLPADDEESQASRLVRSKENQDKGTVATGRRKARRSRRAKRDRVSNKSGRRPHGPRRADPHPENQKLTHPKTNEIYGVIVEELEKLAKLVISLAGHLLSTVAILAFLFGFLWVKNFFGRGISKFQRSTKHGEQLKKRRTYKGTRDRISGPGSTHNA